MKKFIACLLAILILASLTVTAFAADDQEPVPGKIIIKNTKPIFNHGHLALSRLYQL